MEHRFFVRNVVRLGWLATAMLAAGSLQAADDSPYLIEKKVFKKSIRKIALTPLDTPALFALTDEQVAMIEAEMVERLEKKKFDIVPIDTYRQLRDTMIAQIGGLEGANGALDNERVLAVWDHARREMFFRHDVDAIATISMRPVSAPFEKDRAEWDGIKQKIQSKGRGSFSGNIAAASLQLHFTNRDGELAYLARGGVSVLQRREGAKLVEAMDGVFSDDKRLNKAVRLVVDEL